MADSRTRRASDQDASSARARRSWTPKETELLSSWGRRVEAAKHAHYLLATRLRRRNLWLGIPAVVVSAVVGTSLFASLASETNDLPPELRLSIGGLSVAAAALSAMQTFLRFAERSERHVQAGDWYASIKRKIDQTGVLPPSERGDPKQVLSDLRKEMSQAGQTYPQVGEAIWHDVALLYGVDDPPYEHHTRNGRAERERD
jgi:hypothetical protein